MGCLLFLIAGLTSKDHRMSWIYSTTQDAIVANEPVLVGIPAKSKEYNDPFGHCYCGGGAFATKNIPKTNQNDRSIETSWWTIKTNQTKPAWQWCWWHFRDGDNMAPWKGCWLPIRNQNGHFESPGKFFGWKMISGLKWNHKPGIKLESCHWRRTTSSIFRPMVIP